MYQLPNKNWTNVYWGYRDTGGFVTRTRLRLIGMFCLVDPRPLFTPRPTITGFTP